MYRIDYFSFSFNKYNNILKLTYYINIFFLFFCVCACPFKFLVIY